MLKRFGLVVAMVGGIAGAWWGLIYAGFGMLGSKENTVYLGAVVFLLSVIVTVFSGVVLVRGGNNERR